MRCSPAGQKCKTVNDGRREKRTGNRAVPLVAIGFWLAAATLPDRLSIGGVLVIAAVLLLLQSLVRARGFCLFNNVAVAAAHAREALDCERVLIVDWDAHHGNGTQDIFWAEPDVLFFDIHRAAPFYPGSGGLDEVGGGLGEGATVNVPLPDGAGDAAMLKALREILVPAADYFKPDLVLVSTGFDPHRLDLALNVSYAGFAAMTGIVREIAERHCGGRLAMVLEGGYNLESLSRGVHTVLEVLAGADPVEPEPAGIPEVRAAAEFHASAFIPD